MLVNNFSGLYRGFIVVVTIFFLTTVAQAAIYYVSSSAGNDTNNGLSETTPWKTISKVNSIETRFAQGSVILFKRGDTFRGAISFSSTPLGLTVGAYGTAANNPVIAGSVVITGWKKTTHPALNANLVWEANVSSVVPTTKDSTNTIDYLFANGELMTIARYPNVNSPADMNWLTVDATVKPNAFTDVELKNYGKPDNYWVGATLRIRNYSWIFLTRKITGYTAATGKITATGLGTQLPEWGYFIDDKLEEIDYPGEWFYDATAKKVYLYPKNGTDPNTLLVEGATYNTGLGASSGENQMTVENLTFRHFLSKGLLISQSNDVKVQNCYFEHNLIGIYVYNANRAIVTGNTLDHQLKDTIVLQAAKDFAVEGSVIEKNVITYGAMYRLYGSRYDGAYQGSGIVAFGRNYIIRKNRLENIGWNGIYAQGDGGHTIENNVVRKALQMLNDGGGISIGSSNNTVRGNLLFESFGNVEEDSNGCMNTSPACSRHHAYGMGIGADPFFVGNVFDGNTVADNTDIGIRLNAYTNSVVKNNVTYNNKRQIEVEDERGPSVNNTVQSNTIFSLSPSQKGTFLTLTIPTTDHGPSDTNNYCNPYSEVVINRLTNGYSLANYQRQFLGKEDKSKQCDLHFQEYTTTPTGTNLILNPTFDSNVLNWSGAGAATISYDKTQTLLNGGSLKAVYTSGATGNATVATKAAFSLVAGQTYRLKFSVVGSGLGTLHLRVNDTSKAPSVILVERDFAYDTTRKDYEMVFTSPVSTTKGKILFISQNFDTYPYWFDNFALEPVTATRIDGKQLARLVYNDTEENPKSISLDGKTYKVYPEGNIETGSISLPAFSSKVLILTDDIPVVLTVTKAGTGTGVVTSNVGKGSGINCGTTCTESYSSGTAITLTATPDANSTFIGWTGTGCGNAFTMTADMSCTAIFEKLYKLQLSKSETGSGTVNISPTTGIACGTDCTQYVSGTSVTLTAVPDAGSKFVSWTGDVDCQGSTVNPLTLSMTADKTCGATFDPLPLDEFNLTFTPPTNGTITSGDGKINCGPSNSLCTATYPKDSSVTLTAAAQTGGTFAGWGGDCSAAGGTTNPATVTVAQTMNCTATFNAPQYTLNITKNGTGGGQIVSTGIVCGTTDCTGTYPSGSLVTLTITPDADSTFAGWTGNDNCADSFTITEPMDCTATFDKTAYTLQLHSAGTGGGTINSSPTGGNCGDNCFEYTTGTQVTLTATSDDNSTFVGWTGTGCADTFSITANMDCTATFNSVKYTLTLFRDGTGSGQITSTGIDCGMDCTESYSSGSQVDLTATPDANSTFVKWSGAGCADSFIITEAMICTATFNPITYMLTVTTDSNGHVTSNPAGIACAIDCSQEYAINTVVTLTATPVTGAKFVAWTGACQSSTSNLATLTLTSDQTCGAQFAPQQSQQVHLTLTPPTYGVITSKDGKVGCEPSHTVCDFIYTQGDTVELVATPNANATFAGWAGDCSSAGKTNPMTLTLSQNRSCAATFNQVTPPPPGSPALTIYQTGTGHGRITSTPPGIDCGLDCQQNYPSSTKVTLLATPDTGSTFAGWSGSTQCANTLTLTGDLTCTAIFNKEVLPPPPATSYQLYLNMAGTGSGTVSSSPAGTSCGVNCTEYLRGTVVTLFATPAVNSTFVGWNGTNCATSLILMENTNCTATFNQVVSPPPPPATSYQLYLNMAGTGTGTVSSSPTGTSCGVNCMTYLSGTIVTLTATPAVDSTFIGWNGVNCATILVLTENTNCTATFNQVVSPPPPPPPPPPTPIYTLTLTKVGNGKGQVKSTPTGIDCGPTCTQNFLSGTIITLVATPDIGSTFASWSGDHCANSFMILSNMDCTATFNQVVIPPPPPPPATSYQLYLNMAGTGNGTVSSNPTGTNCGVNCTEYLSGTIVALTAMPAVDSTFVGWNGANCAASIVLMENTNCTATFNQKVLPPPPPPPPVPTYKMQVGSMGSGSGQVKSSPSGSDCGTNCIQYVSGTVVTLTVIPNGDSYFAGWNGGNCAPTVIIKEDMKCVATFIKIPLPPEPVAYRLIIKKLGTGNGQVTSLPKGIGCGLDCIDKYPLNTKVTLIATPAEGSIFAGWSGTGCADSFIVQGDMNCNVTFNKLPSYTLTIHQAGINNGRVTSLPTGIECGEDCMEDYLSDTMVTLTAIPEANTKFVKWTDDCQNRTDNPVTIKMSAAKTCWAIFEPTAVKLTFTPPDYGMVTSPDGKIRCGVDQTLCSANYFLGDRVELIATPDEKTGSTFATWGQDCGLYGLSNPIIVTLNASWNCTATFVKPDNEEVCFEKQKGVMTEKGCLPADELTVESSSKRILQTARMVGGISKFGGNFKMTDTVTLIDPIVTAATLKIEKADIGKPADIIVSGIHTADFYPDGFIWYMLIGCHSCTLGWSVKILPHNENSNLPLLTEWLPLKTLKALPEYYTIYMYSGNFIYPGPLEIFFGYRLTEGVDKGEMVLNSTPISVLIEPPPQPKIGR